MSAIRVTVIGTPAASGEPYAKNDCRHQEGKLHDCRTVQLRNALIPKAWAEACNTATSEPGTKRDNEIARAFFAIMDRMAEAHGLSAGADVIAKAKRDEDQAILDARHRGAA
jgi:hypothetical protein